MSRLGTDNVKNGFVLALKRLGNRITSPFQTAVYRVKSLFNESSIAGYVVSDVTEEMKEITEKPASKKSYTKVGKKYIAKKMLYFITLMILVAAIIGIRFLAPVIIAKYFTKTMVINTSEMKNYTGKVKLIDSKETKRVLYIGELKKGRIEGTGELYDYNGTKLYVGEFKKEMYSGSGETFYENGTTHYKGEFLLNKYEGKGLLYYTNGQLCYEGEFAQGMYNGSGTLYNIDGGMMGMERFMTKQEECSIREHLLRDFGKAMELHTRMAKWRQKEPFHRILFTREKESCMTRMEPFCIRGN